MRALHWIAVGLAFATLGCSTASSSGVTDGGGPSEGGSVQPPRGPAQPDFCAVLTKELAAEALGAPVKDAETRPPGRIGECQYFRDAASGLESAFSVNGNYTYWEKAEDGRAAYDAIYTKAPFAPVAGLGEVAAKSESATGGVPTTTVVIFQGHYQVAVSSSGSTSDKLIAVSAKMMAAMPK